MNINRVTIAGNITKPIELKALPSGNKVAAITLATNRVWKDKNGQKQEDTQFVDFVAFGNQAETLARYCVKGQSMYMEGRWSNRSWDKTDGTKGYKTEVVLEKFEFGAKPKGYENQSSDLESYGQPSAKPDLDTIEYPEEEINLEDIPF